MEGRWSRAADSSGCRFLLSRVPSEAAKKSPRVRRGARASPGPPDLFSTTLQKCVTPARRCGLKQLKWFYPLKLFYSSKFQGNFRGKCRCGPPDIRRPRLSTAKAHAGVRPQRNPSRKMCARQSLKGSHGGRSLRAAAASSCTPESENSRSKICANAQWRVAKARCPGAGHGQHGILRL